LPGKANDGKSGLVSSEEVNRNIVQVVGSV
jgi:hypothetical protein